MKKFYKCYRFGFSKSSSHLLNSNNGFRLSSLHLHSLRSCRSHLLGRTLVKGSLQTSTTLLNHDFNSSTSSSTIESSSLSLINYRLQNCQSIEEVLSLLFKFKDVANPINCTTALYRIAVLYSKNNLLHSICTNSNNGRRNDISSLHHSDSSQAQDFNDVCLDVLSRCSKEKCQQNSFLENLDDSTLKFIESIHKSKSHFLFKDIRFCFLFVSLIFYIRQIKFCIKPEDASKIRMLCSITWSIGKLQLLYWRRSILSLSSNELENLSSNKLLWSKYIKDDPSTIALCFISKQVQLAMPSMHSQGLCMSLWGLSRCFYKNSRFYLDAATRVVELLPTFNSQELSSILWSFTRANISVSFLFLEVAKFLVNKLNSKKNVRNTYYSMSTQSISNILWGFATVDLYPTELFLIFINKLFVNDNKSCFDEISFPSLFHFKPQEITNLIWAYARSPHYFGDNYSMIPSQYYPDGIIPHYSSIGIESTYSINPQLAPQYVNCDKEIWKTIINQQHNLLIKEYPPHVFDFEEPITIFNRFASEALCRVDMFKLQELSVIIWSLALKYHFSEPLFCSLFQRLTLGLKGLLPSNKLYKLHCDYSGTLANSKCLSAYKDSRLSNCNDASRFILPPLPTKLISYASQTQIFLSYVAWRLVLDVISCNDLHDVLIRRGNIIQLSEVLLACRESQRYSKRDGLYYTASKMGKDVFLSLRELGFSIIKEEFIDVTGLSIDLLISSFDNAKDSFKLICRNGNTEKEIECLHTNIRPVSNKKLHLVSHFDYKNKMQIENEVNVTSIQTKLFFQHNENIRYYYFNILSISACFLKNMMTFVKRIKSLRIKSEVPMHIIPTNTSIQILKIPCNTNLVSYWNSELSQIHQFFYEKLTFLNLVLFSISSNLMEYIFFNKMLTIPTDSKLLYGIAVEKHTSISVVKKIVMLFGHHYRLFSNLTILDLRGGRKEDLMLDSLERVSEKYYLITSEHIPFSRYNFDTSFSSVILLLLNNIDSTLMTPKIFRKFKNLNSLHELYILKYFGEFLIKSNQGRWTEMFSNSIFKINCFLSGIFISLSFPSDWPVDMLSNFFSNLFSKIFDKFMIQSNEIFLVNTKFVNSFLLFMLDIPFKYSQYSKNRPVRQADALFLCSTINSSNMKVERNLVDRLMIDTICGLPNIVSLQYCISRRDLDSNSIAVNLTNYLYNAYIISNSRLKFLDGSRRYIENSIDSRIMGNNYCTLVEYTFHELSSLAWKLTKNSKKDSKIYVEISKIAIIFLKQLIGTHGKQQFEFHENAGNSKQSSNVHFKTLPRDLARLLWAFSKSNIWPVELYFVAADVILKFPIMLGFDLENWKLLLMAYAYPQFQHRKLYTLIIQWILKNKVEISNDIVSYSNTLSLLETLSWSLAICFSAQHYNSDEIKHGEALIEIYSWIIRKVELLKVMRLSPYCERHLSRTLAHVSWSLAVQNMLYYFPKFMNEVFVHNWTNATEKELTMIYQVYLAWKGLMLDNRVGISYNKDETNNYPESVIKRFRNLRRERHKKQINKDNFSSYFHKQISETLLFWGVPHINEFLSDELLNIDITVRSMTYKENIAIEIDGPSHFLCELDNLSSDELKLIANNGFETIGKVNNMRRVFSGKKHFKLRLLNQYGWIHISVASNEWNSINNICEKRMFLKNILCNSCSIYLNEIINNANRGI